jgi:hypothetical protein
MSLLIDLKYTQLVSPRFEKFQRKQDYLFACRCPLCGDSKKNKSKMRGYIYRKGNDLFYKCHNCGAGTSMGNLIKQLDPALYKEYIMERYKAGEQGNANYQKPTFNIPSPKFDKVSDNVTYENAERCDKLPEEHFCIHYLKNRKIPTEFYSKLYYTDNYKLFCDEIYPSHGKEITADKRLVIPFYDEYNSLIAVSGRALESSDYKLRYVTVRTTDSEEKLLYGMDRVNTNKLVRIVEGPIDSLFLSNCIAAGDANLSLVAKVVTAKKKVLIYDNEPRNKDIVKMMKDSIESGHDIVIWPNTMHQKDINEMIQNGFSQGEIEDIISNNTFSGLEAQTKFVFWKKI